MYRGSFLSFTDRSMEMSRTFAQGSRCCNFISFTPFIDCDPEPGNWEKLSRVVCLNKCLVCMCSHFPLCIWRDEMGNHSNSWTTLFKTIEKHPQASCENWGSWYVSLVVYRIICVTTLSIFKREKKKQPNESELFDSTQTHFLFLFICVYIICHILQFLPVLFCHLM